MPLKRHHWYSMTTLGIFIAVGLTVNFIDKGILMYHWYSMGFSNLIGFHPWTPIIGMIGAAVYLSVLLLTKAKEHWYLWVVGAMWVIFEIVLLYGITITYGWDFLSMLNFEVLT